MQIFLDSTDAELIRHLAITGLVDGVTTNPTLVAKVNRSMIDVIAEICEAVSGPVSAEVVAAEADAMIAEGRKLAALAKNVVVKLPLTRDGLIACSALASEGFSTNVTLCFSVGQALLAAKAGATYVSPFIGRLDDYGLDGSSLIGEIRTVYDNYAFGTKILAASARTVAHVKAAALAGADCATLPVAVFAELFNHPLTTSGLKQFMADWAASGQVI